MPACHNKQAIISFEEKTGGIGQRLLPIECRDARATSRMGSIIISPFSPVY
jgi:hypothetical protein